LRGRTVLLTGAAGRLGSRLVPALQGAGWRVRALAHHRPAPGADESVPGDLLVPESLAAAVTGVQAVVHAAAVTHSRRGRRYAEVNVGGTRALVTAASAGRVERFVHISSHAIGVGGGPYSDSKREAEDVVRSGGVPFTILRLPEVYGAGGEGIDRMIAAARAGRPLPVIGTGDFELRPVHVDDAIDVVARALEAPAAANKTYTLGGPSLTLREAADVCRRLSGGRSRIVSVPEGVLRAATALSRLLPLPVYPDQFDRLRAPRPAPSPDARAELDFAPAPLAERLGVDSTGRA
jgi:nucleoside-diphosphate-sugar epimerase